MTDNEPSIIIDDDSDNIDISTDETTDNIDIETDQQTTVIDESVDGDKYYTDLAREWAIKMGSKVLGEDYSSKHYASEAKTSEENTRNLVEGFSSTVEQSTNTAINTLNETKDNLSQDLTDEKDTLIGQLQAAGDTQNTRLINTGDTYINDLDAIKTETSQYATNASNSAVQAQGYANTAHECEDNAQIWAEGTDEEVQALGGIHSSKVWAAQSAQGQVQADWNETDSTAKAYILNKPTVDQTFDGTSQNAQSGVAIQGELTNYVKNTTLTNTLTDYALLTDIPTVNNGTLTIQKNGTTIGTFTANQSTNSTINIEADTVLTDDITVSKNMDDELQAIGVIDNNSGSAIKYWTGTQVEYNDLKKILIWTPAVKSTNLGNHNWYALAYDGTKFVALGYSGYISTSTDGTIWTSAVENTDLGSNNWMALVYDGTKFVALGQRGYISTSTNGTTWTPATQDANLVFNSWHALAYDGTKFVALDIYGAISTSTDGTTWTPAVESTNLGNHYWYALAYDGTKFVALSYQSYISTSTDGTTWTPATQDTNLIYNTNWATLIYDGEKFIALSSNGFISTSTNGTTWIRPTQSTNLSDNSWRSLAFDGEKFVALGATGYTSIGQSSIDEYTTYVCTDTKNIYKGSISLSANTDLSNLSSTGQAVLNNKVNTSDIWYDSSTSTLYVGVAQPEEVPE